MTDEEADTANPYQRERVHHQRLRPSLPEPDLRRDALPDTAEGLRRQRLRVDELLAAEDARDAPAPAPRQPKAPTPRPPAGATASELAAFWAAQFTTASHKPGPSRSRRR